MPGLSSFCITAAVCIIFIFLLQVSWTVAWLALDQRRIENNKHGIFPWISLPDNTNTSDDEGVIDKVGAKVIHSYSNMFKYWPFKVI